VTAPAVSLVVTTYNHGRFVEQCLDSVAAQTFRDFELLVVDDCSTDDTATRIRDWLDRTGTPARFVVNDRNRGICGSRNVALRQCNGEFFSSLSGDDFYGPDKLARQHEALRGLGSSVAGVFSDMRLVDEDGREVGTWFASGRPAAEGRIFSEIVRRNFLPAPTVMTRRALLEAVGGYDETLSYEDLDMWLKLLDRHELRFVPGRLVNYRLLPTALSRNPAYEIAVRETRVRVLLRWLGRDPGDDDAILRLAWANGRRALAVDPPAGRRILAAVQAARPSRARQAALALAHVPGVPAVLRTAFAWSDRAHPPSPTGPN
jgi:glycosyltransferase involved in cell wall biosynthesis